MSDIIEEMGGYMGDGSEFELPPQVDRKTKYDTEGIRERLKHLTDGQLESYHYDGLTAFITSRDQSTREKAENDSALYTLEALCRLGYLSECQRDALVQARGLHSTSNQP